MTKDQNVKYIDVSKETEKLLDKNLFPKLDKVATIDNNVGTIGYIIMLIFVIIELLIQKFNLSILTASILSTLIYLITLAIYHFYRKHRNAQKPIINEEINNWIKESANKKLYIGLIKENLKSKVILLNSLIKQKHNKRVVKLLMSIVKLISYGSVIYTLLSLLRTQQPLKVFSIGIANIVVAYISIYRNTEWDIQLFKYKYVLAYLETKESKE